MLKEAKHLSASKFRKARSESQFITLYTSLRKFFDICGAELKKVGIITSLD